MKKSKVESAAFEDSNRREGAGPSPLEVTRGFLVLARQVLVLFCPATEEGTAGSGAESWDLPRTGGGLPPTAKGGRQRQKRSTQAQEVES